MDIREKYSPAGVRAGLLLGLLLLSFWQCVQARAATFRPLGGREGLGSRAVFQVRTDSAGFVWAYTHAGIDRYDGSEIRHYELEGGVDSREHVSSSAVMVCDRAGNVWVALRNGRIYAYDREADAFRLRVCLNASLSDPDLHNILFDAQDRLWLCLADGLYVWTEADGAVRKALEGHYVNCLVEAGGSDVGAGDNGGFVAGTSGGVYRLMENGDGQLVEQALPLPGSMRVMALHVWNGRLFIGTFSNGVFVQDRAEGEVRPLGGFVPRVPVRAFAETADETLLVGMDGAGLLQVDMATGQLREHYTADDDDERSLAANTVSDICVDSHGGIWVSTSGNGICYLSPDMPEVRRIRHERNDPGSLRSDHVNVILQDSEGNCWYGTDNGVSLCRKGQQGWTHFLGDGSRQGQVVLALAEDSRGDIWAGGYGIGVWRISRRTGTARRMERRAAGRERGVATDYVYAIYAEGDNIWLGGIEGDLTCYNVSADTYTYYPLDCVGDIRRGSEEGTLLVAGCDGLGVLDKATGEVGWQRQFGDIVLHYPVRCLLQASDGTLWLATDGDGLLHLTPDRQGATAYTTDDKLDANSVNSLLEDRSGRIWFTTEKELYCLDPQKGTMVCAGDFLDIGQEYYNSKAACRLADGRLMFGMADGALLFSPSMEWREPQGIKLIFTDFKLLYESVRAGGEGSLLSTHIDRTRKVSLRYNQNSFSLSFSAINFTAPHRVRYEYILEGRETEWRHSATVTGVNYMELSSGRYRFRLRAFDKYTDCLLSERTLDIVVRPPFWLSGWAWLLYVLLLAAFVYLLVQSLRHKASEARIRERIGSFISFAHDIRTPVSLIKAPLSELETQAGLPDESRKTLSVAMRNVEKLLAMIKELLDLQKTELRAGKKLKVSPYDIRAYLEEKVAEYRLPVMQKGIRMELEVATGMPEVWMDREKMDHILDNLLSNALKYTGEGSIRLHVGRCGKRWSLEVSDTGIGIPKEEQARIFHEYYRARNARNSGETGSGIGLMVTRRIVRQHQGTIAFSSEEGKGTTFTLTFPFRPKAEAASVSGKSGSVEKGRDTEGEALPASSSSAALLRTGRRPKAEEAEGKNVLLLAEDNPDMREYLTNSLSAEYQVVAVSDGGKALEMAREINPDLIISDIIMPVLEGDELCRILKSSVETSHIPVVLLTALSERENIILGLEAGANDYIIKPFDLAVLKVRLRNILRNRQHLREAVMSLEVSSEEETEYASQLDKEFLDKVMKVVQEEMSNSNLTVDEFCSKLAMSRTSTFNKLKALTGQSPNDFIRIARLNKARELLLSHDHTIMEVATLVGFADPKYFSTCFKKQFGVSPSKL